MEKPPFFSLIYEIAHITGYLLSEHDKYQVRHDQNVLNNNGYSILSSLYKRHLLSQTRSMPFIIP